MVKWLYVHLIETVELIHTDDEMYLKQFNNYDWLIFTSQNGVEAFCKKLKRYQMDASHFSGKIAAVGEKTAQLLRGKWICCSFYAYDLQCGCVCEGIPSQ